MNATAVEPERVAAQPSRAPRGRARWLAPALLVLVAFVSVALHVHTYTQVGPVDELQHIDYLYKAPAYVAPGDHDGQQALQQEACRGLDYHPFVLPPCVPGAHYDPAAFQEAGYNTAYINTPLYYTVTKVVAQPILWLTPADDLVTAGRLAGGVWLAAGLLVAFAAGRRLGANRWALAGVLLVLAVTPAVIYPSATISPDASTFLVGASALWVVTWWEQRPQRRWWALAVLTALALALKMTNVVVLLALGLYLLLRLVPAWRRSRAEARPWIVGGVTLAVTAAVMAGGWLVIQAATTHGDLSQIPMNARLAVSRLDKGSVVDGVGQWLTPLGAWASVGSPVLTSLLQRAATLLVAAGTIAAAAFGVRPARERSLAVCVTATALLGASAFVVVTYYLAGQYVPPPGRYAYSLVPTMGVLTALQVQNRPARLVVLALGLACVVVSCARLV